MLYMLKRAKRANFSTIGIFVNLLMPSRPVTPYPASTPAFFDTLGA